MKRKVIPDSMENFFRHHRSYFRPKLLVAYALMALIVLFSISQSTTRWSGLSETKPLKTTVHTIPVGHRTLVVSNFNGRLIWYENGASGAVATSHRIATGIEPINSRNGEIRVEIPFQFTMFSLIGYPATGNLPGFEIIN